MLESHSGPLEDAQSESPKTVQQPEVQEEPQPLLEKPEEPEISPAGQRAQPAEKTAGKLKLKRKKETSSKKPSGKRTSSRKNLTGENAQPVETAVGRGHTNYGLRQQRKLTAKGTENQGT